MVIFRSRFNFSFADFVTGSDANSGGFSCLYASWCFPLISPQSDTHHGYHSAAHFQ